MQAGGVFHDPPLFGPPADTHLLFPGYAQPSLLAFAPYDPNLIVAGGHDSGVFVTRTGGFQWQLVTDPRYDPSVPARTGVPHLTNPRYAYFDPDAPGGAVDVYIGTVGRGVWRMRLAD
jgi:hypothetical protein